MSQKLLKMFGSLNFYMSKTNPVQIGKEKLKLSDKLDKLSKLKDKVDRDHHSVIERIKFLNNSPDLYFVYNSD